MIIIFSIISKQKFTGILVIIFGTVITLYSFAALAYRVSFAKLLLIAGIFITAAGAFILQNRYIIRIPRGLSIAIKSIFVAFLISFIVIESLVIYSGSRAESNQADYLVILGAGLWGDTPSLALKQRLDEGLAFITKNPTTIIVLSGGKGPGETITEAEAMKKYLVERGVEEKFIITEDKSTNTKENLQFTKELLEKQNGKDNFKIALVTNNFHMFRAKLIAKSCGFKVYGQPAPLHPLLVPAYYIREYMAVIKSAIFDLN